MSPSIEFYQMPESPPCRAVEMLANMLGITLNKHYVNLFKKDQLKEEYVKLNPMHKVPFIIDGDLKLGESRAIMAYLVNQYKPDDQHLYPKDPKQRSRIDEMLYFEIGTLHSSAYKVYSPIIRGLSKDLNTEDVESYKDVLRQVDNMLDNGKKYLFGDHLTIADISFAATLTFPVATGFDLGEYTNLTAYYDRLKAGIPNFHLINDEPMANMKKFFDSKRASA